VRAADQLKQEALGQFAVIEKLFTVIEAKRNESRPGHRLPTADISEFNSLCLATIERIAGKQHTYSDQARTAIERGHGIASSTVISPLYGIVLALKRDVEADYLVQFSELEHASLFADFIEMGDYLLELGYKDAAAVLAGGVLESHLRQLAAKHGVSLADVNPAGESVPRKAERLNQELAKSVYGKLDQKNVTVWLDLRNKAAHAEYTYSKEQVELFSQGLKLFMVQYPA